LGPGAAPKIYFPVPVSTAGNAVPSLAAKLLAAFLSGRKETTIAAYRADLRDFQKYVEVSTLEQAAALLIVRGQGEANGLALAYKSHLMERGLASLTVNRRLTALRSMVCSGGGKSCRLTPGLDRSVTIKREVTTSDKKKRTVRPHGQV
jgi:hypothetical protein